MRGFIVKYRNVLVDFWLESTVGALCKVLVVGSSNWMYKYPTIPVVFLLRLLFRLPRYSMTFAVTPFRCGRTIS